MIVLAALVAVVGFGSLVAVERIKARNAIDVIEARTVHELAASPPTPTVPVSLLDRFLRETIIVTTKDQSSFKGVLWESDDKVLVLRNAVANRPGSSNVVQADGEIIVQWKNVEFVQRP